MDEGTRPRGRIAFGSDEAFVSGRGEPERWRPQIAAILERHRLPLAERVVAGVNPTWPTFVCGDVVVKLLGHLDGWRDVFDAERAALRLVATDTGIAAPRLLADGTFDDGAWAYLVTTRVHGRPAWPDPPPAAAWPAIAAELGRQVRHIHALDPAGIVTDERWPTLDVRGAAERSSLPSHLVAQVDDFVARLRPYDRVFCHGDLVAQHVFVDEGHVTGIIDWADALVTDRHYELVQVFRDTFDCDKDLFRMFLEASAWPVGPDFATRTLGHALRRQAMMLAQHAGTGDVFEPIAERFALESIATLDELATELFDV